jgi:hypothetical protein
MMIMDVLAFSHSSVPKLIEKAYIAHKRTIKKKLHNSVTKIHFTIDMWTSHSHRAYQAIVAHFIDSSHVQRKALLALREHKGSNGGEEQAEVFLLWITLHLMITCYAISQKQFPDSIQSSSASGIYC